MQGTIIKYSQDGTYNSYTFHYRDYLPFICFMCVHSWKQSNKEEEVPNPLTGFRLQTPTLETSRSTGTFSATLLGDAPHNHLHFIIIILCLCLILLFFIYFFFILLRTKCYFMVHTQYHDVQWPQPKCN